MTMSDFSILQTCIWIFETYLVHKTFFRLAFIQLRCFKFIFSWWNWIRNLAIKWADWQHLFVQRELRINSFLSDWMTTLLCLMASKICLKNLSNWSLHAMFTVWISCSSLFAYPLWVVLLHHAIIMSDTHFVRCHLKIPLLQILKWKASNALKTNSFDRRTTLKRETKLANFI